MKTAARRSGASSSDAQTESASVLWSCASNPQPSPHQMRRRLWWSRTRLFKPRWMSLESAFAVAVHRAGRLTIQAIRQVWRRVITPASGDPCRAATQPCDLSEIASAYDFRSGALRVFHKTSNSCELFSDEGDRHVATCQ